EAHRGRHPHGPRGDEGARSRRAARQAGGPPPARERARDEQRPARPVQPRRFHSLEAVARRRHDPRRGAGSGCGLPGPGGTGAIVVLVPIALASCGGGGGGGGGTTKTVSPDDYASRVCGSLQTWLSDIKDRSSSISTAISPGSSPQKGQDVLRTYLDGVISDT